MFAEIRDGLLHRRRGRPLHWILWHPHQKLWNWALLRVVRTLAPRRAVSDPVVRAIVWLDTLLLALSVRARRLRALGGRGLLRAPTRVDDVDVFYLDLGTHRAAAELDHAHRWLAQRCSRLSSFGFEASRASFESAKERLGAVRGLRLIHVALGFELPEDGKLRLYHSPDAGLGDSLYRQSESFEVVEVVRLSSWLRAQGIDPNTSVCLLRMNIEGAEYDVIRDLVEAGLVGSFAGYFGMWDDVAKIDVKRDREFRALLARHSVHPVTFNGRDLASAWRVRCIEYDLATRLEFGRRKAKRGGSMTARVERRPAPGTRRDSAADHASTRA
jgi:FkbM family methyltransferase